MRVSTKERMPEAGKRVIVGKRDPGFAPYLERAIWNHGVWENWNWHCDKAAEVFDFWMEILPLPEVKS